MSSLKLIVMRFLPLVAVLAIVAISTSAAAAATISAPVSDGARWLAWASDASTTAVLDARTGELLELPSPAGCGTPTAAGGGVVAYTCAATAGHAPAPVLLNIASGLMRLPAGTDAFVAGQRDCTWGSWSAVGSQWMRNRCDGYHYGSFVELNWRTGATRSFGYGDFPGDTRFSSDRRDLISLSTASGHRTLCNPARLSTKNGESGFGGYFPSQQTQSDGGWVAGVGADGSTGVVVQRCGSAHAEVLCAAGCTSEPVLGGGWVSWTERHGFVAVRLGRHGLGKRVRRTLPAGVGVTRAGSVVLFTGAQTPVVTPTPVAVRAFRLPGAPELPDGL